MGFYTKLKFYKLFIQELIMFFVFQGLNKLQLNHYQYFVND